MNRKHHLGFIVVLMVTVLVSLGCGLGDIFPSFRDEGIPFPTALPPATTVAKSPVVTTPASTPTRVASLAPTVKLTAAPTLPAQGTPPALSDMTTNLDKLDSFRSEFSMKSEGVEKATNKQYTAVLNLVQELIKSKKAEHFIMDGTGFVSSTALDKIEFYEIDKQGYIIMTAPGSSTPTCMSFSSDKPTFDITTMMTPDEIMGKIQSGSLVARGEMVNGVKTDHYKLSNVAMGFGTATSESGEVWIAQDGGYVVRFTGQAEGDFKIATAFTGKITWIYELKQINQVASITPPPICTSLQPNSDVPVPPNATQKNVLGDMITFASPDAVKTVTDWYVKQAPAQGWTVKTVSSMDALVMLNLTKDTRTYSVMIVTGSGNQGSSVVISKTK